MLKYKKLDMTNHYDCKVIFENIFNPDEYPDHDFDFEWTSMLKYGKIYGIFYNEKIIGFCSWVKFNDVEYMNICNLTIDKLYQKKGYGKKLTKYVLNKVKNKKNDIIIHTNEKDFFETVGFDVVIDFEDDDTQPYRYIMIYKFNI